ncbi:MAG: SBBP repeat-containing protein [Chitinophagales bacterium]|nr:SBBP repeat-containing protein [Chitinophagales bacterium]
MNLIKFYTSILIICIGYMNQTFAQIQTYSWITSGGSISFDAANGIACDKKTNAFVVGSFVETFKWDSFLMVSRGLQDVYYGKFDNDKNVKWMNQFGGTGDDVGNDITIDKSGNLFMVGYFSDTVKAGVSNLISRGAEDAFVIKADNKGKILWGASGGGTGFDEARAVTTDKKGNVYISGVFFGTAYFGNTVLVSQGDTDIFFAKYSPQGSLLWVEAFGGKGIQTMQGIKYDSIGNCVYAGGYFQNTIHFGSFTLTCTDGKADDYLVKFDTRGNTIWAYQFASPAFDDAEGVAVDYNGDPYLVGYVTAPFTFRGVTVSVFGSLDPFLAKISKNGGERWVRVVGSKGEDVDRGAVADLFGNIYWIGGFEGTATFETDKFTSAGKRDVFVCKYDTTGKYITTFPAGGTSHDRGRGVDVVPNGDVFICGRFTQSTTFGSMTLRADGFYDPYVAKIGYCNPPFKVTATAPGSVCQGSALQLNAVPVPFVNASYKWSGPNNFSSSTQSPIIPNITTDAEGTYTVLAESGGCFANDDTTVNVINCREAEAEVSTDFIVSVSPNPNNGNFLINLQIPFKSNNIQIRLSDILGRTVFQKNYFETNSIVQEIQLNNIVSNVVFAEIRAGSEIKIIKIITH